MDNELDSRLRRLEVASAGQREVLDGQAARLEQIHALLDELLSLVRRPEPAGPPLHEVLGQLIAAVGRNTAAAEQTLVALKRLAPDSRAAS